MSKVDPCNVASWISNNICINTASTWTA